MEVENKVSTIGNEETAITVETLLLDVVQLGKEGRNVNDDTGANEASAARVDETRGEEVEVELGLDAVDVSDDGVSGVVTTSASCANVHLTRENIGKLALALVTPLGP